MNAPLQQTTAPQMDSNPLQRALDNYLLMELQCEAAKQEAADIRTINAKLVAEVEMIREQLATVEIDRRKWQVTSSTLFGRLMAINDTIAGAVRSAVKDGLEAIQPEETIPVVAAAAQIVGMVEVTKTAPEAQAPVAPPQGFLAAVPQNDFQR